MPTSARLGGIDAKIGSFSMMPDDKHLFVSAKGVGYLIDARTHTLVEQISLEDTIVAGEALRGSAEVWVGFSVNVRTGEVRLGIAV